MRLLSLNILIGWNENLISYANSSTIQPLTWLLLTFLATAAVFFLSDFHSPLDVSIGLLFWHFSDYLLPFTAVIIVICCLVVNTRWKRAYFAKRWTRCSTRRLRSTASTPISWAASRCISLSWVSTGSPVMTSLVKWSTSWRGSTSSPATRRRSASVARLNRDTPRFH